MLKAKGFDKKYLHGDYHLDGVFQHDLFKMDAGPLVQEVLEDIDENQQPQVATQFGVVDASLLPKAFLTKCLSYVRRRKEYLVRRAKKKSSVQVKVEPKAKRRIIDATQKTDTAADTTPADTAKSQDKSVGPPVSYDCIDCPESMASLDECYPEEDRSPETVFYRCKSCYAKFQFKDLDKKNRSKKTTEKETLNELKPTSEAGASTARKVTKKSTKRAARRSTPKPTKRKASASTPKASESTPKKTKSTTLKGYTYKFSRFQNVMAKWGRDGYFAAQVTGFSKGDYRVYFPADGQSLSNVPESALKMPGNNALWAKIQRSDVLGYEFALQRHKYKVENLGTGKNINKYVCINEAGFEKLFDIGELMKRYLREVHPIATRKLVCVFAD